MRAAYDALPAETKARLEELHAHHSIAYSRQTLGFEFSEAEQEKLRGAVHPLVRTIPRSGRRSLYLASHASRIVEWPVPEGRLLLRDLVEHATQPSSSIATPGASATSSSGTTAPPCTGRCPSTIPAIGASCVA